MNRKIVLALVCVAACVFLLVTGIRGGLGQAGLWAAPLGGVAGIVAAAAAIWALIPGGRRRHRLRRSYLTGGSAALQN